MSKSGETSRIETESEVKTYLDRLKYAIDKGAKLTFQKVRIIDTQRDYKYTNDYTVNTLFPNENPVDALKQELKKLTVEEYIETVKDLRFSNKSEMRVFGKTYNSVEEVYIKIRVELLGADGAGSTFVMSFHFAEKPFESENFPYKK